MTLPEEFYRRLAEILLEIPRTRDLILQIAEKEGSEERESEDVPSQAGRDD